MSFGLRTLFEWGVVTQLVCEYENELDGLIMDGLEHEIFGTYRCKKVGLVSFVAEINED